MICWHDLLFTQHKLQVQKDLLINHEGTKEKDHKPAREKVDHPMFPRNSGQMYIGEQKHSDTIPGRSTN